MCRIFIAAGQNNFISFIKERDKYVFSPFATFCCLTFPDVSDFVENKDEWNR